MTYQPCLLTIQFLLSPSFSMLPPSSTVKLMVHLGGYSLATIQGVLLYKKIKDQRKGYNNI